LLQGRLTFLHEATVLCLILKLSSGCIVRCTQFRCFQCRGTHSAPTLVGKLSLGCNCCCCAWC